MAGSQAAIQSLPLLRAKGTVGVVATSYAEHAYAWRKAGHSMITFTANEIDVFIDQLDVLVLVNPNNPTAETFTQEQCLHWLERLRQRNGWLVVDEAFMDCTPASSLIPLLPLDGLVILRSIGKFFGLAGARAGFVLADAAILQTLQTLLGPWPLSNPSRFVCAQALQNQSWQMATQQALGQQSQHLYDLLKKYQLTPSGSTALFQWVQTKHALTIHQQLARQALLTRFFEQPMSLRFGLPADEAQWQQLESALQLVVMPYFG